MRQRSVPHRRQVNQTSPGNGPLYLGIEAGGTRTVALLVDEQGIQRGRLEAGPANLRLMDQSALLRHFRELARALPRPDALAIGMAGARTESDRARIRRAAEAAWPDVPCHVTNDLETALLADASPTSPRERRASAQERSARRRRTALSPPAARVLVLSGTGSCCFGRSRDGQTVKVGGWGHFIGDKGSGYEIGLRALKAVVFYFDRDGQWPALGRRLLRALQLNEPNDLIGWVQTASKADIAALAIEVFQAAAQRDGIASDILSGAMDSLARDAEACARRLAKPGRLVEFVLAGSVILRQPHFRLRLTREIQARWKQSRVVPLQREGAWGAVALARQLPIAALPAESAGKATNDAPYAPAPALPVVGSTGLSPTEQRHPRSRHLDRLPLRKAIELMLSEERKLPDVLWEERHGIERGIKLVAHSLQRGGRLFYVGAGTSGRLGVLDASECPPTFRTDPEMVQGIMAGGQRALWQAVEGAEDDSEAGARAVEFRGVQPRDTVVGIAASGRTPFVWGALREAKRRGASTILLCFNPHLSIPRELRPTLVLAPRIGPEILTGSTRLKAGTATKLILNMFTTLAMVRLGKVMGNLMIDVNASNAKLRERAIRIVRELTGADAAAAQAALLQAAWKIRAACARLPAKITAKGSRQR
jgi:N-acetylmuramic acid 6-phosphate etherase